MGHDSGDGTLQEPAHIFARQLSQSYVHQRSRHSPHLMWEEGIACHLDLDGLIVLPYVDPKYLAECARFGPVERPREPGKVIYSSERLGRLHHLPHIKCPSQVKGRPSAGRRPRRAAIDSVNVRPCGGAPSRVEGVGNLVGHLHRDVVRQVAVESPEDDVGRMAGIRIEGGYLPDGMDASIGATCRLDSDGLACEASYSFFDLLLYRWCVLLILEPAVTRPFIFDYECVSQCTAYALRNACPFSYSTSSRRAIGDASPLRGPTLMMRV